MNGKVFTLKVVKRVNILNDINSSINYNILDLLSPGGGIGRHKGLKIPRQQWRAGSSPAPGTTYRA